MKRDTIVVSLFICLQKLRTGPLNPSVDFLKPNIKEKTNTKVYLSPPQVEEQLPPEAALDGFGLCPHPL